MSGAGLLLADKTGEAAKAGPIGLVVILVLCIASYFLFKSMSKHMKKVRDGFPVDGDSGQAGGGDRADAAAPGRPARPRADVLQRPGDAPAAGAASTGPVSEPASGEPVSGDSAPVDPVSGGSAPGEPAPVDPAPDDPALADRQHHDS